ncbi:MAG: biotin/lipoyl-binding protein [Acidobacteriota bacterium]|jgi:propionyl-CoA carboxylase alpha chain
MKWWVERDGRRFEVVVSRQEQRFSVRLDGHERRVSFVPVASNLSAMLDEEGRAYSVAHQRLGRGRWRISLGDREFVVQLRDPLERETARHSLCREGPQEIRAPIPGKVVRLAVSKGDVVTAGQPLLVLEAMKMENPICAEGPGRVDELLVAAGATVEGGQLLVMLR